jgi:hypothetical protein
MLYRSYYEVKCLDVLQAVKKLLYLYRAAYLIIANAVLKILRPSYVFLGEYIPEDNSTVVFYASGDTKLSYAEIPVQLNASEQQQCLVSLIAVAKNEADNVISWCESIFKQARVPDEIVVVDTGSTDGTADMLAKEAEKSPVPFKVMREPGCNIARGRNLAIRASRHSVIVATDFGCQPVVDWLENIVAPFEQEPSIQVAVGLYEPVNQMQEIVKRGRWRPLVRNRKLNSQTVLMPGASGAFTRKAWMKVGGYPEWLTMTGEDTYFSLELKRLGGKWAFVPEAVVKWTAPDTILGYWRKMFAWAAGDGESGVHASQYWNATLRAGAVTVAALACACIALAGFILGQELFLWLALVLIVTGSSLLIFGLRNIVFSITDVLWEVGAEYAKVAGFLWGCSKRSQVTMRKFQELHGIWVILSGVPIDDTGGGARAAQITLELLQRGFGVVYVNYFQKRQTNKLHLIIKHPNLLTYSLPEFKRSMFIAGGELEEKKIRTTVLVECPLSEFLPVVELLHRQEGVAIYDLMDDWATSLGGRWYSADVERSIIKKSQVFIATTQMLAERLEKASHSKVVLLPNAVNSHLFRADRDYARPADLPAGAWTAIYIGALWGEWFDWELLREVAIAYPEASVVIIGDYRGQCSNSPSNLHFLGLKSHMELPAYLSYSDVAFIPWQVNAITEATSPLKLYEYVAMRMPVVAPNISVLAGIPGVQLAGDSRDFIHQIGLARNIQLQEEDIDAFVRRNSWAARLDLLIDQVGRSTNQSA